MGFPARQEDFPAFPKSLTDIDPATIRTRRELAFDTASFRADGQPGGLIGRRRLSRDPGQPPHHQRRAISEQRH